MKTILFHCDELVASSNLTVGGETFLVKNCSVEVTDEAAAILRQIPSYTEIADAVDETKDPGVPAIKEDLTNIDDMAAGSTAGLPTFDPKDLEPVAEPEDAPAIESVDEATSVLDALSEPDPDPIRAHNEDGTFAADNPDTPSVNEAWEVPPKELAPEPKAKAKKASKPKATKKGKAPKGKTKE